MIRELLHGLRPRGRRRAAVFNANRVDERRRNGRALLVYLPEAFRLDESDGASISAERGLADGSRLWQSVAESMLEPPESPPWAPDER